MCYLLCIQWNLSIEDKVGPGNLSTVERLSTSANTKNVLAL